MKNEDTKFILSSIIGISIFVLFLSWFIFGLTYIDFGITEKSIRMLKVFVYPFIVILFISIIWRLILEK